MNYLSKFLKEKGLLQEFIYNMTGSDMSGCEDIDELYERFEKQSFDHAFSFPSCETRTPDFWIGLRNYWFDYYESIFEAPNRHWIDNTY